MRRRRLGGLRESGLRTIAGLFAAAAIAIAAAGCDSWGADKMVTSPSDDPALIATIKSPVPAVADTRIVGDLIPFVCSSDGQFTGPLDITMTAAHDVDLDEVAIRLVRLGEGFSSSTNRFDEDDLAEAFGTTQIPGGTVRTFRFRTRLACGRQVPESVAADIRFVDFSGHKNSITVSALFVSQIGNQ
jgi:hypothetical protein